MLGTLNGGLEARGIKISGSDIVADAVGEMEVRDGLPILTAIVVRYTLRIPAGTREPVERALSRHMEKCPTAATLRGAVEVRFTADIQEV
jgi:organic hydroperoxide reductase OsmC/OhrA